MLIKKRQLSQIMETAVDWQLGWIPAVAEIFEQEPAAVADYEDSWWFPAVAEMSSTNVAKSNL
jgi:hypothetical protein